MTEFKKYATFSQLLNRIKENDIITIHGHAFPDGDCFGSQIGLRDSLRLAFPSKKIYAVGSGLPRFKKFLGETDIVSDEIIKQSLAILVDGNDLSRMEDKRVYTAKQWIKFDHHVDSGSFVEGESFVDENACSACEIIANFIIDCKLPIDKQVANALFLGILTDSGRFQYINDFSRVFELVAKLCKFGAEPNPINQILNLTNEEALKFKGFVFSNYEKTKGGVLYLILNKEQLFFFGISANKAGSMVNLLSNVKGYPIWAFFCENDDGTCHAEFRSNGPFVQPVAAKYGGGGHQLAAGVTLKNNSRELIKDVLNDLDLSIKEYKEDNKSCGKKN